MKLPQLTLFNIILCYILGIISYPFWELPFELLWCFQVILLLGCIKFLKHKKLFGICVFCSFWLLGIAMQYTNDDTQKDCFYAQYLTSKKEYKISEGIVSDVLKSNQYNSQYVLQLHQLNENKVCGKVLLSIQKDSLQHSLQIDDRLQIVGQLREISSSKNPHQFDFAAYMRKQGVEHQLYAQKRLTKRLPYRTMTLRGLAHKFREFLISKLKIQGFEGDDESVIKALVLGDRTDISSHLKNSYADAGAVHLLAISGLHIGVLLLLLNSLFSPLLLLKQGRFIRMALVVVCLWGFAFITGLSASVSRSVTMFSALALGIASRKIMSPFQTLLISLFVLLLIKPHFIYEVGFQLSYLAVFGILWLMPIASQLWKPRWWVLLKLWQLFALGVIAQLFVLPLSIYYFHQFPSLFFVTNLVIVPFMGVLLGGGMLIIVLGALDLNCSIISETYGYLVSGMNGLVEWVAQQDSFVIRNIPFGLFEVIILFVSILSLGRWLEKPLQKYAILPLLSL